MQSWAGRTLLSAALDFGLQMLAKADKSFRFTREAEIDTSLYT
jgi:hypothetical protein